MIIEVVDQLTLKAGPKKIVHVNMHHIKHNTKNPESAKPVFTVKQGRKNYYSSAVEIKGPSKLIYRPSKPLSCGARVWISTEAEIELRE